VVRDCHGNSFCQWSDVPGTERAVIYPIPGILAGPVAKRIGWDSRHRLGHEGKVEGVDCRSSLGAKSGGGVCALDKLTGISLEAKSGAPDKIVYPLDVGGDSEAYGYDTVVKPVATTFFSRDPFPISRGGGRAAIVRLR